MVTDGAPRNQWQELPTPNTHSPMLSRKNASNGQDTSLSLSAEPAGCSRSYSRPGPGLRSATPQRRGSDFTHSDFWFDDGNFVIITGNAAFKVHRGQLERHSEVFAALFALPQPPGAEQDLVDGCPYVELHDSPSDVFYFLRALYDGLYFKFPRANDFPAVAAALRLSTKYMVESLRLRCLHRLHLDWPTSLQGWDERESVATDNSGRYLPWETRPHPILVIQLALEMGISTILPAAFYDLSRYAPCRVLAGTTKQVLAYDIIVGNHPAAPVDSLESEIGEPLNAMSNSEPSSGANSGSDSVQLSHALLCKTLRGREASQRYIATLFCKELNQGQPASDCLYKHRPDLQRKRCMEAFHYVALNLLRSVGGVACGRDADPLFALAQVLRMLSSVDYMIVDQFGDGANESTYDEAQADNVQGEEGEAREPGRYALGICTICKVALARVIARAREEVWGLLPTWFELGWNADCYGL